MANGVWRGGRGLVPFADDLAMRKARAAEFQQMREIANMISAKAAPMLSEMERIYGKYDVMMGKLEGGYH